MGVSYVWHYRRVQLICRLRIINLKYAQQGLEVRRPETRHLQSRSRQPTSKVKRVWRDAQDPIQGLMGILWYCNPGSSRT
jgi:hypothetical protein